MLSLIRQGLMILEFGIRNLQSDSFTSSETIRPAPLPPHFGPIWSFEQPSLPNFWIFSSPSVVQSSGANRPGIPDRCINESSNLRYPIIIETMCDRHRPETQAASNGAVPRAAGLGTAISGLGPNSLGAMGIGEGAAAKSDHRVPLCATILGKSGPAHSRPRPEPPPDPDVPQVLSRDSPLLRFLGDLLFGIRTSRRS